MIRNSAPGDPRNLRLHGKLARELGQLIVSGTYVPGQLLETEMEASDRYRVSRAVYREAVRMLAAKGLVEARPKVGTRVTPRSQWSLLDPDVLAWMFASQPDDESLDALFELRLIVEPEAAALAARRRTPEQLDRMKLALAAMAEHTIDTELGRRADQEFHAILITASHNPFLQTLTSSVATAVSWTTALKTRPGPLPRDPVPDHAAVLDAIAAGDAEGARDAMSDLVRMALKDMKTAPWRAKGAEQAA